MPDWFDQAVADQGMVEWRVMMTRLSCAFVLGCVAAMVHFLSSRLNGRKADHAFLTTLILLSLLIALVTQVIGNNAARAFSLVGTLAIVRFRTVVEDTRDTAFVIYAVVSGMAAGSGYVLGPVLCAPLVLLTICALSRRKKEKANGVSKGQLIIRLAPGRMPDENMEAILSNGLKSHRLIGVATARNGSAVDATYAIQSPAPGEAFQLLADLSKIEGVLGVELKD